MRTCDISITTVADGKKTSFSAKGEMLLSAYKAQLAYREEQSRVQVYLETETAMILREGDYTLRIPLKRGEMTSGTLGVGGNEGEIKAFAYKVEYSIREDSLLAILHYDLLFGEGRQEMKLRVVARADKKVDNV